MSYQLVSFNFHWILIVQSLIALSVLSLVLYVVNSFLKTWNEWFRLAIFLFFSIFYSFLFFRFFVKFRFLNVDINNFEVIKIDDSLALISFTTNEAHQISLIQLSDGQNKKIIDPTNTLRPQLVHDYLLDINEQKSKILFKIDQSIYYFLYQAIELRF